MKVLWENHWLDVPVPTRSPVGVLIEVDAIALLMQIRHASGRVFESRWRKLAMFALVEGPVAAYRKARAKLRSQHLTGDYWVLAFLGREVGSGGRVGGLACRVPPAATVLQTHRQLILPLTGDEGDALLTAAATRLRAHSEILDAYGGDSYLFSGRKPPKELVDLVRGSFNSVMPRTERTDIAITKLRGETTIGEPTLPGRSVPRRFGIPVALLGAGDYARSVVIPALKRGGFYLYVVADREPQVSALTAKEFGFELAAGDADAAIAALPEQGLVVVATNHDSHATLAASAASVGHRVFLEKPPVVTDGDLDLLVDAWELNPGAIEVGFNRRYHQLIRAAQRTMETERGPVTFTCLIREVPLESNHWYLWPNQGTRVAGNLCHWIDLAIAFAPPEAIPETVSMSPPIDAGSDLERALSLRFDDGSVTTLVATGRGDPTRGVQEWIEVRRGNTTVVLDDLWRLRHLSAGRVSTRRTMWRNKGHVRMYAESLGRVRKGTPATYPLSDLIAVSVTQIAGSSLAYGQSSEEMVGDRIRSLFARSGLGGR